MELLESDSPKSELVKKSIQQRKALEEEVKVFSDRTEKIITNALIVGGALALTYWIVSRFMSSDSKSKSKRQKLATSTNEPFIQEEKGESKIAAVLSDVGTVLASQATAFLLALAKEKLMEFLASQVDKKKEEK